jgi:uncharacterized protein YyaL (SSP411 family)
MIFFMLLFQSLLFTGYSEILEEWHPSSLEISAEVRFSELGWEKALNEAKVSGMSIFLNFHATWCAPCKLMKFRTFTNKELADYLNSNFINLRLDGEEGEGKVLMEALGLSAYPSTLFIGPDGNMIWGKTGYLGPNELLNVAKKITD